jgi:hypothetical protein
MGWYVVETVGAANSKDLGANFDLVLDHFRLTGKLRMSYRVPKHPILSFPSYEHIRHIHFSVLIFTQRPVSVPRMPSGYYVTFSPHVFLGYSCL